MYVGEATGPVSLANGKSAHLSTESHRLDGMERQTRDDYLDYRCDCAKEFRLLCCALLRCVRPRDALVRSIFPVVVSVHRWGGF